MIEPTFKMTQMFFDRVGVAKALDQAKKRNLSKAGAFIRRRARSLLRKRKKTAPAGSPPSVHSGEPNLRTIYFVWEPDHETVVVGPVKLNGRSGAQVSGQARTVPGLHERGGRALIRRRAGGRRGGTTQSKQATYKPRPFMGPALDAEISNFPELWNNSVRP